MRIGEVERVFTTEPADPQETEPQPVEEPAPTAPEPDKEKEEVPA